MKQDDLSVRFLALFLCRLFSYFTGHVFRKAQAFSTAHWSWEAQTCRADDQLKLEICGLVTLWRLSYRDIACKYGNVSQGSSKPRYHPFSVEHSAWSFMNFYAFDLYSCCYTQVLLHAQTYFHPITHSLLLNMLYMDWKKILQHINFDLQHTVLPSFSLSRKFGLHRHTRKCVCRTLSG